jgi:plasmid stabilization system protein ParE
MTIIRDDRYIENLQNILDTIAKDGIRRSNKLRINLDKKINNLPNMPYKFRQSHYYEDKNIRDLIFKGYTISKLNI